MTQETIQVPDIGGTEDAEVIELCVAVGDRVEVEQSLIVVESDKASMEIPSPLAGTIVEFLLQQGDAVAEGSAIVVLEVEVTAAEVPEQPAAPSEVQEEVAAIVEVEADTVAPPVAAQATEQSIVVPDIGTSDAVEVIEVCVAVGDSVSEGDSLVVLESDKASMEIPAPAAGEVLSLQMAVGDSIAAGDTILMLRTTVGTAAVAASPLPEAVAQAPESAPAAPPPITIAEPVKPASEISAAGKIAAGSVYAGPAVRKLAREFGVPLAAISGSGPRGRILKEDLHQYAQKALSEPASGGAIPAIPAVDFSHFGEVDVQPLSRIDKLTAANMSRNWLNVPHVTQFDDADVTELEDFRRGLKAEGEKRGTRLTPLPFLLKACAAALLDHPKLNSSLHADGQHLVYKRYVHIGVAVATPAGLMVPVLRDVDKKNLWELAEEVAELADKAKSRRLKPAEMQGGCFTISSLGGIGGTGFTPIVNAPEVAILGVSKLQVKPQFDGEVFVPRKMLPLSLSYDHRVVNGADAGAFLTQIERSLADIRQLLL